MEKPHTTTGSRHSVWREPVLFTVGFFLFFTPFAVRMGLVNMMNTMMNTAYDLLMGTVFELMAICVLTGALSGLLTEFGVVEAVNRLLSPLLWPLYRLPGAAALGIVTTFLSDNPAVLSLAGNRQFRGYFKKYQLPALTNLGTSFGMGLIVCTYMIGLQGVTGVSYLRAVLVGLCGAVLGSIVSTRLMLRTTRRLYGTDMPAEPQAAPADGQPAPRPRAAGGAASRFIDALMEGGKGGVEMGMAIIPGVLIICTFVMMLTNGPSAGGYTGAAYEGIALLPWLAGKLQGVISPLFGFASPQALAVPVTALGAAAAALGLVGELAAAGLVQAGDIAVFTAMCMCWSGYLSTHVSMMNSLGFRSLTGRAILCHTIGGLCAGVSAHWLYLLLGALL